MKKKVVVRKQRAGWGEKTTVITVKPSSIRTPKIIEKVPTSSILAAKV